MRLTPWEEERLLVFTAAELARRHRAAGLPLNAPETVAIICDAMLEAARAGADYPAVEAAGRAAVRPDEVMPGVRELVDEVSLEVLIGDGTRLIVLLDPLGAVPEGFAGAHQAGEAEAPEPGPGSILLDRSATARREPASGRPPLELTVRSESGRVIVVSSHYPFDRVNRRLLFDRDAARGYRLDLPSGGYERWAPGEEKVVRLVRVGGDATRRGPRDER